MRSKSTSPTRVCPNCKTEYDRDDYGHQRMCYRCTRNQKLILKYNITLDDWEQVLEGQRNSCAICGAASLENRLVTHGDADHREFYGIVCLPCLSSITAEKHYAKYPGTRSRVLEYIEASDDVLI